MEFHLWLRLDSSRKVHSIKRIIFLHWKKETQPDKQGTHVKMHSLFLVVDRLGHIVELASLNMIKLVNLNMIELANLNMVELASLKSAC